MLLAWARAGGDGDGIKRGLQEQVVVAVGPDILWPWARSSSARLLRLMAFGAQGLLGVAAAVRVYLALQIAKQAGVLLHQGLAARTRATNPAGLKPLPALKLTAAAPDGGARHSSRSRNRRRPAPPLGVGLRRRPQPHPALVEPDGKHLE